MKNKIIEKIIEVLKKMFPGYNNLWRTTALEIYHLMYLDGFRKFQNISRTNLAEEMTNQYITDEKEQAIKRGGEDYAKGYIEGLVDGVAKLDKTLKELTKTKEG